MRLQANRILSATAFVAGLFTVSGAFAAQDPTGVWMNDTGRGAIEIKNCSTGLCGHVVWVKEGVDSMGCGKQIIGEAKPAGDGTWEGGWIYNPDKKKRYDVEIEPQSNGTLRVMGYAGVRFLSKTMIWKRAPDDLVRCDASAEAAPAARPAPRVAKAQTFAAAEVLAEPAPKAAPPAKKPAVAVPAENDDEVNVDTTADDDGKYSVNLDEGIEVGDVFKMKRDGNGKCKINAPFVNITVDCDRNKHKGKNDDND